VTINATAHYHTSPSSIGVRYDQGWAALYLSTSSQITGSYNTLRFWVRGANNTGPHTIQILFYNAAGQNTIITTVTAVRNQWTQIDVPFGSYALSDLRGIAWQENTGAARSRFWIDDIQLVRVG
jgi:hypothetical protein